MKKTNSTYKNTSTATETPAPSPTLVTDKLQASLPPKKYKTFAEWEAASIAAMNRMQSDEEFRKEVAKHIS